VLVIPGDTFAVLSKRAETESQVFVSVAQVVAIEAQVVKRTGLEAFVILVLGFVVFVRAILLIILYCDAHSPYLVIVPPGEVLNHLLLLLC